MASCTIICSNIISYFVYYGGPPMATAAISATVANREQAIVGINREASRNMLISCLIYTLSC